MLSKIPPFRSGQPERARDATATGASVPAAKPAAPSASASPFAQAGLRNRHSASAPARSAQASVAPRTGNLPPSSPDLRSQAVPLRRANDKGSFESKIPATPAQQLQANQQLREKIDVGMFPYQRIASGNYRPSDRLSTAVADVVWTPDQRAGAASKRGLLPSDQVQRPTGTLVDNASGLVVSILVNHKDKDIAAVFGGTTAGRVAGSPLRLALGNREMAMPQWTANAKTGLGLSTRSHEQAQQVVGTLRQLQQTPQFRSLANYTISTMGHSKGGGEAASAAIANYSFAAPITVTGLSSAPLHTSQLRGFAAKGIDVADAERHINIYSVKLDPVPKLGHLLKPAGATVVGAEHFYPAPVWADPVTRHVKSDRFIGAALKKQDEALMKALEK